MLKDIAKIGNQPKLLGKSLTVILFPLSNKPPDIGVPAKLPVSPIASSPQTLAKELSKANTT